jgi:Sec-independent protein translocase protein TatA
LHNRDLRKFIGEVQRQLNKDKKEEKINYKLLKKKTKPSQQDRGSKKVEQKKSIWF